MPCKELLPPGATTPRRGGAFAAWAVHGYGVFRARRLETSRATATASAPLAPRPPLSIVSSDTPAPSLGVGACGDGSSHRHVHKGVLPHAHVHNTQAKQVVTALCMCKGSPCVL